MKLTKNILRTTENYIKRLEKGGIETVEDLLLFYPRDIEDTNNILDSFAYVNITEKNTIKATLINTIEEQTRTQKKITKFLVIDKNNMSVECVFFHTPFFRKPIKPGDMIIIHGKPKYEYGKLSFPQPDIELFDSNRLAYLPIYTELQGISTKWFREKIPLLFDHLHLIPEILPEEIIKDKKHLPRIVNIQNIHAPKKLDDYKRAISELAYEELFEIQYKAIQRKKIIQESSIGHVNGVPLDVDFMKNAISKLPFPLTNQQKITLFEIVKDMEKNICMQRLLQGDVGTGKTIVSFLSLLHWIHGNGGQVVYLAPTTILASQVAKKLEEFLNPYGIGSSLLLGSMKNSLKKEIKSNLEIGSLQVVVGTHALLEEDVSFQKLSYVIIDEQHRFGVEQRNKLTEHTSHISSEFEVLGLSNKSLEFDENPEGKDKKIKQYTIYPHVLMMTATPIPRTLSMALYGHQDISIIREYPANRKKIHTKIITENQNHEAFAWIENELQIGHQAYWVSPLVHENDSIDAVSVHETAQKLQMIFPNRNIGILHGKLTSQEKDNIMNDFRDKKYDILSATTVIEVGVDNPNATIMCIENAHRFGLSQLHQLRGRVGRGDAQSYCYLLTDKTYSDRLKAMEKTQDGFELSEIDMELRGPGEVYGVRQSGIPDLKLASIMDLENIYEIRRDIEKYMNI